MDILQHDIQVRKLVVNAWVLCLLVLPGLVVCVLARIGLHGMAQEERQGLDDFKGGFVTSGGSQEHVSLQDAKISRIKAATLMLGELLEVFHYDLAHFGREIFPNASCIGIE